MKELTQKDINQFLEEKFSLICDDFRKEGIIGGAYAGTLIGVIREGKLLEGDDDIDTGMVHSHYKERKLDIERIANKHGFNLRDKGEIKGLDISKLIYKEMFIVNYGRKKYKFRPFIDIHLATSVKKKSKVMYKWGRIENILTHQYISMGKPFPLRIKNNNDEYVKLNSKKLLILSILALLTRLTIMPAGLIKGQQRLRVKYADGKNADSDMCALHYANANRNSFLSKTEIVYVDALGTKIPVQKNYKQELEGKFKGGETRPKVENRLPLHFVRTFENDDVILDPFFVK